ATKSDGTGDQARLLYESGPVTASAAYGKTKLAAGDITMANAFLAYDFGVVKPQIGLSRDRAGELHGRGLLVGAIAPIGAHQLKAAYSTYKRDAEGSPRARKLAIGDVYALSKRTFLYVTYAHVTNSGGSATA